MPLHLLGKKSWNVYNPAAIARVRADEAAAAAHEEAEEQRQDAHDAQLRLAILRGLPPPKSPSPLPTESFKRSRDSQDVTTSSRGDRDEYRKRRRLRGEDDTDRDIRVAHEERKERDHKRGVPVATDPSDSGPLTDHAGHIQLFHPPSTKEIRVSKDVEADHKRQVQESAEQGALRFSDAAGLRKNIKERPWYAELRNYSGTEELDPRYTHSEDSVVGRNAFGNLDEGRNKRDSVRLASADPMAMMRQAQTKLKEVDKERQRWKQERERELKELQASQDKEERRRERRRRDRKNVIDDDDGLEGFSLDAMDNSDSLFQTHSERLHKHGRRPQSVSLDGSGRSDHRQRRPERKSSRETRDDFSRSYDASSHDPGHNRYRH